MLWRTVVLSDTDNHVQFSMFKSFYPGQEVGAQGYNEHKHADLEISCILNGWGFYNCHGQDYPFGPGDIFLHCSNEVHYFRNIESGERPALVVIRFEPRFLWSGSSEWFNGQYRQLFFRGSGNSRIPHDAPAAKIIGGLLTEMYDECHDRQPAYELVVKAKLMTILANMVRHFGEDRYTCKPGSASQAHQEKISGSMNYILTHLSEPLTLDQLAREACLSRSYYSAIFKELNGMTVWEYIVSQRINMAQYRLETTDAPIMRISGDCGFTSLANFNRTFKKATGKSPREYRKKVSEDVE